MYMERIHRMFPKAKFLLLIRDARATVKSINDLNLWRWGFERNNFTVIYMEISPFITHDAA
jgi:hypothetical protein